MENKGYLDIHTHILPGVDDGSRDWTMTQHMMEMAYEQGVETIIATPHNYPGEKKQDNAYIRQLCAQAQEKARDMGMPLKILPGNEVFYREDIVREIEKEHILTLADSRYVLVEYHPGSSSREVLHGVRHLTENGYLPVIAHMERVQVLLKDAELRRRVLEAGGYLQVNCQSLLGSRFDRRAGKLRKLVEKGEIHFLGSDCHNLGQRPPVMRDAISRLRQSISEEMTERVIYENANKLLRKEYI